MVKHICDICGNEILGKEKYVKIVDDWGKVIDRDWDLEICPDCERAIKEFIDNRRDKLKTSKNT